jgi:1-acyl-sn-glycerol-3-phosphate acyltransferase
VVSWLPLYHDMGLIGAWLGGLYAGAPVVIMSPLSFLSRPARWLRTIGASRGTISAAPNFGYELAARKVDDEDLDGVDLSSWRLALNGAESVSPATLRRFSARFARFGFRPQALMPVYGLAENAVGLAFPPLERGPRIERIDRDQLSRRRRAEPVTGDAGGEEGADPAALEVVSCGLPLPGHEIRIVDGQGREREPRAEGEIEFRGPSATAGYYSAPDKTRALFDDGWLRTGDLGFIADGELFVTGRSKDLLIHAGRNLYPQELEDLIGDIEGIRKGCVAVFGGPGNGTEKLIVVAETREADPARQQELRRLIDQATISLIDIAPDEVVLAPPHAVQKTSSGKIRRSSTRELYLRGRIGAGAGSVRVELFKVWLAGAAARGRRALSGIRSAGFAAYFWATAAVLAFAGFVILLLVPSGTARWRIVRGVTRLFFRAAFLPLRVAGIDRLAGSGLVVANHASYLDGLVLAAALPGRSIFLAKRELADRFFTRVLFRRAGALFVERYDPSRTVEDARRAASAAGETARLVIFPEGGTTRRPGVASFGLGAFSVAVKADLPAQPVVLRGTRAVLQSGVWFPRRGAIEIEVGPTMRPAGPDMRHASELRDRARAFILERCGEPDLAREGRPRAREQNELQPAVQEENPWRRR